MLVTVPGFIVFMPYLSIHTNANLGDDRQSELLAAASKIGSSQLSKPEEYMMVSITPVGRLFFGGSEDPAAFLELRFPELQHHPFNTTLIGGRSRRIPEAGADCDR
jgi:Macrophage migration inhibitory factor (MIF)